MENRNVAVKPPSPFNPSSPVEPNDFVGRVQDLESFRQKLMQTTGGSLASMAVAGGYGIGKTSFLHKCKAVAEEQNALAIYFSLNEVDELTKETLARTLIQRVQEKVREEIILKRISSKIFDVLGRIKIRTDPGIEISLTEPFQGDFPNLQSALAAAWSALKSSKTAIVFFIDEARALEKNRAELMLYMRAVLEHLQSMHVPVMIIPAGKLSISGPSGTGFSPLVRTFPPAILENFSREESRAFVDKKLGRVGMSIAQGVVFDRVFEVTEGHPFVLSAYVQDAYYKLQPGETELKKAHFEAADLDFVARTLSPFFSRFYDQNGRTYRRILMAMAQSKNGELSLSDIAAHLKKAQNEISSNMGKLVQDGAIVRIDRGRYKLFHHLLGEYINKKEQTG